MSTSITRLVLQGFKSFNRRTSIPLVKGFNIITGPNGSGKTIRGDAEVLLANGDLRPIKDIVEERISSSSKIEKFEDGILTYENPENLEVLGLNPKTMKIEKKRILAFIKRKGDKELYLLETKSGKSIVATASHPVIAFEDEYIIPKRIIDLKVGDLIATPSNIKLDGRCLDVETKLEVPVNEDFARLLGYLIGDGYIGCNRIDFTNKDDELIKDVTTLCKRLGLNPRIRKSEKSKRVYCYSAKFYRLLCNLFELEKVSSETKQIPKVFLFANERIVSNLLASLFDCDGYVSKCNPEFEYSTKSRKLAYHVQFLLLRLGIISSIKEKFKRATNSTQQKEKYYSVYVSGIENIRKLYEKIPLLSKEKVERIKTHLKKKIKPQRNVEDILPRDVNKIVKKLVKELGLEVKKLRKQYPILAAYVENRCYPTTNSMKNILSLFLNRIKEIETIKNTLRLEKKPLLEALSELKITKKDASKAIGLHEDSITSNWRRFNPTLENLKRLKKFIEQEIKERLEESKRLVKTLKTLIKSDIFWDKVVKIEKVPGEEWIYDLSIPNCHNFIANGIFVHNSNLVDAICFVLGRTSAKSMRADRLHELIFHGNGKKKSADYAAVTLYLDNSKKVFPFEEEEIFITRKVNRSGVSVYKLNGKTVTREKILEVLSASRIYPNGYNIVLQGDVTQIIEMNPVERRFIIDEISGIAEYNDKKEKAQRDLAAVDEKLREAEIIISQKYDIFKKLEEERNAAIKFQNLQRQLLTLKASYAHKKMVILEENLEKLEESLQKKMEELEKVNKDIEKTEEELERRESETRDVVEKLLELSRRVKIEKEVSELRSKLLINKDRIDSHLREINRLESLIEKLEALEVRKAEVTEIPRPVKAILDLKLRGVYGTVADLISVPEKYRVAIEVAAGPHLYDIVVENDEVAAYCIEYLRREKIGRATFIPLNKIKPTVFDGKDILERDGVVGVASKLIKYDIKFMRAMEFVFGNTLVVENLDIARAIGKGRIVTLEGDLIERSGAMIGGYYVKTHPKVIESSTRKEIEEYRSIRKRLQEEVNKLLEETKEIEERLKEYAKSEEMKSIVDLEKLKISSEKEVEELRTKRRKLQDRKVNLEIAINQLNIEKAKVETELQAVKAEVEQYGVSHFIDEKLQTLESYIKKTEAELKGIGSVNLKAIEEYEKFKTEFDEYKQKYEKILNEKKAVLEMIEKIEEKRKEVFNKCLQAVSNEFHKMFHEMTGGSASLSLEDPNNLESGLVIQVNFADKRPLNIDSLSGGEKTLTALAFMFAIQRYKPAPFYIFDEVDAALDKQNTIRIAELIKKLSKDSQFIVISHNDQTIKYGDVIYGCSMVEGESKIIGLEMPKR
jgi:chromosome segregation protein